MAAGDRSRSGNTCSDTAATGRMPLRAARRHGSCTPPRVVHGGAGPLCGPTGTPVPWPRAAATTTIGVAADPTVRDRPEASTTGPRTFVALAFRGGGLHRSRGRGVRGNGSSDRHSRPTGRTSGSAAATAPRSRHRTVGRHRTSGSPPDERVATDRGMPPHRGAATEPRAATAPEAATALRAATTIAGTHPVAGLAPAAPAPGRGLSPRAPRRTLAPRAAHGAGPPSRPCRRGSRAPVSRARGPW